MKQWVIWLAVVGFAYVAGNQCDSESPAAFHEDLVRYETLVFPLYGQNEAELNETCNNINTALYHVQSYVETCFESEDCDENCTQLIKDVQSFVQVTGLMKLVSALCDDKSAFRQTYLDNAECLENTAEPFAVCHNTSQRSQHYIHGSGRSTVEANCCYISWYKDCFTNETRRNCGENATFIVSLAAHYLLGDIANKLCSNSGIFCDKPPLPEDEIDNEVGNETDKEIDNEIDTTARNELDEDESDNEIDNGKSSSCVTMLYSSTMLVLPYVFSVLLEYTL